MKKKPVVDDTPEIQAKIDIMPRAAALIVPPPRQEAVGPPPVPVSLEPKYLGDCTVDYKPENDVAKIAWAAEEGIRRVELPGWVFDKLRVWLRNE